MSIDLKKTNGFVLATSKVDHQQVLVGLHSLFCLLLSFLTSSDTLCFAFFGASCLDKNLTAINMELLVAYCC